MSKTAFIRAAVVAFGILYVLTGLAMLFAPEWFYQNIGNFPPFNRHYVGDLGSFNLPLGLALLWAARDPLQHRLLIGYAAIASLIHALNHAYDDILAQLTLTQWLTSQTVLLLLPALLLVVAWWQLSATPQVKGKS